MQDLNLEQTDIISYNLNCTNENVGLYKFNNTLNSSPSMLFILRYKMENRSKKDYIVLGRLLNYGKSYTSSVYDKNSNHDDAKDISRLLNAITSYKDISNPIIAKKRESQIEELKKYMYESRNVFNFQITKEMYDIFVKREALSRPIARNVHVPLLEEENDTFALDLSKAAFDKQGETIEGNYNPNFASIDEWEKLDKSKKNSKTDDKINHTESPEDSMCEKLQNIISESSDTCYKLSEEQISAINKIKAENKAEFCDFINKNLKEHPEILEYITQENSESTDQNKLKLLIANLATFYMSDESIKDKDSKDINVQDNGSNIIDMQSAKNKRNGFDLFRY